jgi:BASS family bile acid:Na+ symporter
MLATIASFLAGHALAMLMLSAGLRTESSILRGLGERRRVLVRALLVVWLGVPLLALAILYLVRPAPMHAATLMVMAICPGVPLVLRRSRKGHGDPKTTLLILIATAATAFVMIPLWVAVLAYVTPLELVFGLRGVATVLLPTIVVPFAIGRVVFLLAPRIAKPLATIAQSLFVVGIVVVSVIVIARSPAGFRELGAREVLAALLVPLGAAALGYWAGRPAIDDRISTTYAAVLGNPALAIAVITPSYAIKVPALIAFVVVRTIALVPFNVWLERRGGHREGRRPSSLPAAPTPVQLR